MSSAIYKLHPVQDCNKMVNDTPDQGTNMYLHVTSGIKHCCNDKWVICVQDVTIIKGRIIIIS